MHLPRWGFAGLLKTGRTVSFQQPVKKQGCLRSAGFALIFYCNYYTRRKIAENQYFHTGVIPTMQDMADNRLKGLSFPWHHNCHLRQVWPTALVLKKTYRSLIFINVCLGTYAGLIPPISRVLNLELYFLRGTDMKHSVLLAALVATLALTACGKKESTEAPSGATSSAPSSGTTGSTAGSTSGTAGTTSSAPESSSSSTPGAAGSSSAPPGASGTTGGTTSAGGAESTPGGTSATPPPGGSATTTTTPSGSSSSTSTAPGTTK